MLSVTLRLLSLVALGVAQKQTVSVWMPPDDSQLFLPANNTQLTHDYIGCRFNNICTRLLFPSAEGRQLGR